MSDQNEENAIAEVPASEELTNPTETRSWKKSLSWAAVTAALVVGGVGGYAAGNNSGDHGRLEFASSVGGPAVPGTGMEMGPGMGPGMGPDMGHGKGPGMGHGKGHDKGMGQGMGKGPGDQAPHCHDAAGTDTPVEANGLCADGSEPGFRGPRANGETVPNTTASPSASPSAVTQ